MDISSRGISDRLRILRIDAFGPRGKSRFATVLGIRASTYQEYESNRVPPVDLLVRAAEITGCDLVWLLTGIRAEHAHANQAAKLDDPVVERVRELLHRRPETAQSLSAFLLLIDPNGPSQQTESARVSTLETVPAGRNDMIPVVGSTAAGTARYWRELTDQRAGRENSEDEADARLRKLLAECQEQSRSMAGHLSGGGSDPGSKSTVALVQLSQPNESGIIEFLSCPGLADRATRLVAWRIDGDSMAPRYRDGDFVLVSPDETAIDGAPCVAHQRGQIGVNCKIFKQDGLDIVLIPVNESLPPQRFPASELEWAHRVRYCVRLLGMHGI